VGDVLQTGTIAQYVVPTVTKTQTQKSIALIRDGPRVGLNSESGIRGPSEESGNINLSLGYGPNDKPVRIEGKWSNSDIIRGLKGKTPIELGRPDLHHADQMPGSAIHEILSDMHRGNKKLHPNKYNQGVTTKMREQDRKLHWWYRAREEGGDQLFPDLIYDK